MKDFRSSQDTTITPVGASHGDMRKLAQSRVIISSGRNPNQTLDDGTTGKLDSQNFGTVVLNDTLRRSIDVSNK